MAVPQITLQRLETMGARILSQSDDAIRFVTKKGDDISIQWGKRNILGEMKDYVCSLTKINQKTGASASMNRRVSERVTGGTIYTDTQHLNTKSGVNYETYARHSFGQSDDPSSLTSFNFEKIHYDISEINNKALGTTFATNDGLKLAYTIAKGEAGRYDSIRQGVQKINLNT